MDRGGIASCGRKPGFYRTGPLKSLRCAQELPAGLWSACCSSGTEEAQQSLRGPVLQYRRSLKSSPITDQPCQGRMHLFHGNGHLPQGKVFSSPVGGLPLPSSWQQSSQGSAAKGGQAEGPVLSPRFLLPQPWTEAMLRLILVVRPCLSWEANSQLQCQPIPTPET